MSEPFDANKVYEYLLRQLVAESYLDDLTSLDPTTAPDRQALEDRLRLGNNASESNGFTRTQDPNADILPGASRMTQIQINEFLTKFRIVSHHPNDASGFSATLMQRLDENGNQTNEYTLAFRSTEFRSRDDGGDAEHDGFSGADGDLLFDGFALAQLKQMEDYYRQLRAGGDLPAGAELHVTGYSLGGHLATVFSEIHYTEIAETYVFNAAGRGSVTAPWSLATLIEHYAAIVANPYAAYIRGLVSGAPPIPSDGSDPNSTPGPFEQALASPEVDWADPKVIVHDNFRHKWAMRVLDPYMSSGLSDELSPLWAMIWPTARVAVADPEQKLHHIIGIASHDDDTATAKVGISPPHESWIFIEDQPEFYGDLGYPVLGNLGYPMGDWLRTHSITLLGDSLALMRLYQHADRNLSKLGIETIFAAASNQRAYGTTLDRSRTEVEGASLEDALYALERALSPDRADLYRVQVDLSGAGFGHLLNRTDFHRRIAGVEEILLQWALSGAGDLVIKPLISMRWVEMNRVYDRTSITAQTVEPYPINVTEDLIDKALQNDADGLAYRFALRELSPIVVLGADYSAVHEQLKLREPDGDDGLTEEYVRARAEFLAARLERGVNDKAYATATEGRLGLFEDRGSGEFVGALLAAGAPDSSLGLNSKPSSARLSAVRDFLNSALALGVARADRFGSDLGDTLFGAGLEDRLFGADGNDLIDAKAGVDYLEGGAGSDRLLGGSGADRLVGGSGDDELVGGTEDDVLVGGAGADTYVINPGDGTDIIRDTGRNFVKWNGRLLAGFFESAGATGFYRFIGTDPGLKNLTLTFNSPATLSDGSGAALVFEDYQNPEAFDDGDFGIKLLEEVQDPVTTRTRVGDDRDGNVLEGAPESERIEARGGIDEVYGFGGDDYVDAGEGDDLVYGDGDGSMGNDLLIGGKGSDRLIGDRGNDRLYGDERLDLAQAIADESTPPDPAKGDWLAAGEGDDQLIGSAGSDVLTGGGGEDVLVGGAGADFLMGDADYRPHNSAWEFSVCTDGRPSEFGSAPAELSDPSSSAADVIYSGAGDDWAWAGLGDDLIYGGEGKDLLFGNSGSDVIEGGDGDDLLAAGGRKAVDLADPGDDYLSGGVGNDTLYGSAGDTILFGEDGDDLIVAGPGDDFVDGGPGNDRISSSAGSDLVDGGDGDDQITAFGTQTVALYGGEGADLLRSDQGEDALFGGNGDDALNGDEARDVLDGGAGNDRYVVGLGSGVDEIYDESGEDVLEIESIEGIGPEYAISRDSLGLVDDDSGGISLAFGILGYRVELGPDPLGVIERIEVKHYVGSTFTIEVIEFAELWEAYLGPTVQPNSAPVVAQLLPDGTATEDESFIYEIPVDAFFDPDPDDLLWYTASLAGGGTLPAWLGFDPATQTFFGLPTNAAVGIVEVSVTATDLAGASASASFLISVANANDAPLVAGSIAPQAVEEESLFQLALPSNLFADEDAGDTLRWSAALANGAPLPNWLVFDPDAKTLRGTPTRADVGAWSVSVSARDDAEATASLAFDLTVTKAPGQTLSGGGAGSEVLQGGPGDDTLLGGAGADAMIGGKGDDTFVLASDGTWSAGYAAYNAGSPGNPGTGRIVAIQGKARLFDTLDGGEGLDTVQGTAGPDAVFLDDGLSPFPGAAGSRLTGVERFVMGAGNDTVDLTSFDYALGAVRIEGEDGDDLLWASAGDDTLLGGLGRDELYGGAGADYLAGGAGDDSLDGAYGTDVLQGGEGNDTLLDAAGGGLLDGGAGNDALNGGAAPELFAGGKGSDSLRPGGGNDVVLVNRGDGADRIAPGAGAKALSLGGGIAYEDLALERIANRLVVHLGNGETVELTDWYAGAANQGFRTMQVIAEAMAGFDPGGADPLRDNAVERFDFQGLVAAFDAARAADSMITRWQAMHALLDTHLGGSDEEALGGEPAYRYGMTGTLGGQSIAAAQAALASPDFGSKPQAIAPSAGARGEPFLG